MSYPSANRVELAAEDTLAKSLKIGYTTGKSYYPALVKHVFGGIFRANCPGILRSIKSNGKRNHVVCNKLNFRSKRSSFRLERDDDELRQASCSVIFKHRLIDCRRLIRVNELIGSLSVDEDVLRMRRVVCATLLQLSVVSFAETVLRWT